MRNIFIGLTWFWSMPIKYISCRRSNVWYDVACFLLLVLHDQFDFCQLFCELILQNIYSFMYFACITSSYKILHGRSLPTLSAWVNIMYSVAFPSWYEWTLCFLYFLCDHPKNLRDQYNVMTLCLSPFMDNYSIM